MGKEIKTRAAVKDIKLLDKAASGTAHVKNAFVKSKDAAVAADRQAEQAQDTGQRSPREYATDKVSGGVKDVTQEAAHRLKKPQTKARENVNKAKEQFNKTVSRCRKRGSKPPNKPNSPLKAQKIPPKS
ncbi:MAG: hypothetical protein LBT21_05695 [Oscillospiraceae bacterium]|jgi:hypothetical protein|nr:hypothetical protein [Oscillospiraceae bacterium]